MTLEQAKQEAARRWNAFGGFAEISDGMCRVGVCRVTATGIERSVIGEETDWPEAFDKAERWWERQTPIGRFHKSPQQRAEQAGGLPMAGDLFEK